MRSPATLATLLLTLALLGLGGLGAVALGAPWGSRASSASATNGLACSVKPSCATSEVEVLRMSSTSNAHAGTPSGPAYGNRVCCTKFSGLGTQCAGNYDVVLTLSGASNAHVASDGSYATQVCLSGGDDATVDCTPAGACPTDYACLATIAGSTNAQVADCDGVGDYGTKVCCLATPDNCPTVPNPGQQNADGDQWGDACDNCPTTGTPWYVPLGDEDCDGFTTTLEGYVGTDPLDACPDGSTDDAWPPDINMDTWANILDVLLFKPVIMTSVPPSPARYDVNADGKIDILDVLLYKPVIMTQCTNP
jgi:hypothetical protein